MYLSRLKLWNFRRFGSEAAFDIELPNLDLPLCKGLNVLVGENDSGKTAIIDAIRIVLGTHSVDWNRITEDDFHNDSERLRIELHFDELADVEGKNFIEWLSWHTQDDKIQTSLRVICDVRRTADRILPYEFRAGADPDGSQLSGEARDYLKCTYLRPLRDAEIELIPRRNSRLSRIFQAHPAFKGKDENHFLVTLFRQFNSEIQSYFHGIDAKGIELPDVQGKNLKAEVDKFVQAFCSHSIQGLITVSDGNLKNILERLMLSIADYPNPGLGTLNRLFMAAELVHLSKQDWTGLRMGLIEEIEAHLHPQAQLKVIESLQSQQDIQLLLTSHSPNIASKLKLESLILCDGTQAFPMGHSFTELNEDDYRYLESFLDVTKSNMFFSTGIVMVEGWAEELLIPALAKKMKTCKIIDQDLTEAGVSVVNVGGTAFLRFAKIFLRKRCPCMTIPIAIVTDIDVPEYHVVGESCIAREPNDVRKDQCYSIQRIKKKFDLPPVKVFIAPHWTLEYSLLKSPSLKKAFTMALKKVHKNVDESQVESEVARKLIKKGLRKQALAYEIAQIIEADIVDSDDTKICPLDKGIQYLMDAIKYACGVAN